MAFAYVGSVSLPSLATVHDLVPFAHVADLQRSIDFYARLGFGVRNRLDVDEQPVWAWLESADARLMIAIAGAPIRAEEQAVLFYAYSADLPALRDELISASVEVGEITHPDHMQSGELRVHDPDGYVLLIGQMTGRP